MVRHAVAVIETPERRLYVDLLLVAVYLGQDQGVPTTYQNGFANHKNSLECKDIHKSRPMVVMSKMQGPVFFQRWRDFLMCVGQPASS